MLGFTPLGGITILTLGGNASKADLAAAAAGMCLSGSGEGESDKGCQQARVKPHLWQLNWVVCRPLSLSPLLSLLLTADVVGRLALWLAGIGRPGGRPRVRHLARGLSVAGGLVGPAAASPRPTNSRQLPGYKALTLRAVHRASWCEGR